MKSFASSVLLVLSLVSAIGIPLPSIADDSTFDLAEHGRR